MPVISNFYGILIKMYFADHAPPHFHAIYAEYEVIINIDTLEVIEGSMPSRPRSLIIEWASLHREELREDWKLCQQNQMPNRIAPLE